MKSKIVTSAVTSEDLDALFSTFQSQPADIDDIGSSSIEEAFITKDDLIGKSRYYVRLWNERGEHPSLMNYRVSIFKIGKMNIQRAREVSRGFGRATKEIAQKVREKFIEYASIKQAGPEKQEKFEEYLDFVQKFGWLFEFKKDQDGKLIRDREGKLEIEDIFDYEKMHREEKSWKSFLEWKRELQTRKVKLLRLLEQKKNVDPTSPESAQIDLEIEKWSKAYSSLNNNPPTYKGIGPSSSPSDGNYVRAWEALNPNIPTSSYDFNKVRRTWHDNAQRPANYPHTEGPFLKPAADEEIGEKGKTKYNYKGLSSEQDNTRMEGEGIYSFDTLIPVSNWDRNMRSIVEREIKNYIYDLYWSVSGSLSAQQFQELFYMNLPKFHQVIEESAGNTGFRNPPEEGKGRGSFIFDYPAGVTPKANASAYSFMKRFAEGVEGGEWISLLPGGVKSYNSEMELLVAYEKNFRKLAKEFGEESTELDKPVPPTLDKEVANTLLNNLGFESVIEDEYEELGTSEGTQNLEEEIKRTMEEGREFLEEVEAEESKSNKGFSTVKPVDEELELEVAAAIIAQLNKVAVVLMENQMFSQTEKVEDLIDEIANGF